MTPRNHFTALRPPTSMAEVTAMRVGLRVIFWAAAFPDS